MRLIKKIASGRIAEMRHRRNKRFFTLGFIVGGVAVAAASKLCGKFKCKKCIKRLLAEKK